MKEFHHKGKNMRNIDLLLTFLENSEKRIGNLLKRSKRWSDIEEYRDALDELESLVPNCKAYCYGTKFMELGHERSHLNVFIDVDNAYWENQNNDKIVMLTKLFEDYFKAEVKKELPLTEDNAWNWKGRVSVLKTPISTVRSIIEPFHLQCDVTFKNGLGVENTKLINYMFRLQPEAFKLYHFARIWIHIDEFAFKRYVVGLLVIFYLQQKNLMPSVVKLQEDVPERFIDGWNVNFNPKKKITGYGMTLIDDYRDCLSDFFKFYGEFKFEANVISTFLGRAVPIANYPGGDEELLKYKDQIKSFVRAPVNIADHLNLNYNCGHGVGKKRLTRFRPFCTVAVQLLDENLP